MTTQVKDALNAMENNCFSLQQVLQNQRNPDKGKTAPKMKTTDCIAPPKPHDDGSWTKVKASTTTSNKKGYERTLFPSKFPIKVLSTLTENNQSPSVTAVGITITIKLPNSSKVTHAQFLQAMLLRIQMVSPWASILPFEVLHNTTVPEVVEKSITVQEITKKSINLDQYMEEPSRKYGSSKFTVQGVFSISVTLQKY